MGKYGRLLLHVAIIFLQVTAEHKVVGIQREMNEARKNMNAEIEKLRKEVENVTESYQVGSHVFYATPHFFSHFATYYSVS